MKRFFFLFLLCSFISAVSAQDKLLTMEDAMLKARTALAPENLKQIQFFSGTGDFVYLKKIDGMDTWVRGNGKEEFPVLTLTQLNTYFNQKLLDTAEQMPAVQFSATGWTTTVKGFTISIDPTTRQSKIVLPRILSEKENIDQGKAGYAAYLEDYNLFVTRVTPPGVAVKVTKDGSKDIVYASSVHRDEFGISKGTFWSNAGTKLAYYRMDQSMVTDYPVIDWSVRPAKANLIKYPMAGDKSHRVTVGVYDVNTQKTTWLKTGEPAEQYLTNIAWSPDDKYIYIAVLNREQNHMWLKQFDAATGNFIKTLFEETDDKYVEPLVPMLFVPKFPGLFVWQSNRDGYNHLYLYDSNGKMVRQLTKGKWEVLEVKGFDNNAENLYYVANAESPVNKDLYSVHLKTGTTKRITGGSYTHNTILSDDKSMMLDIYSSTTTPRVIDLVNVKTRKTSNLLVSKDPLEGYSKGELSLFTFDNTKGNPIWCRMFKPANFDSTKKYPVIVYWYGGPHVQLITNSWNGGAGDYWFQYMAERGYLVFSIDPRGSDNRGKEFEQSMFRKLGDVQMDDMMDGIHYLSGLPYADTSRMGLFGWSFGGFMTTDFVLNHPGVFKVAVAGGPVMDWKYYEIMYTERYMDTPKENPLGYAATDLTKQAGNLKDDLLLIHGLQDPVVVQQHSVNFVKACVDKGIQIDYMIYPGHEHNVLGKDRAHLYQKVSNFITDKLESRRGF